MKDVRAYCRARSSSCIARRNQGGEHLERSIGAQVAILFAGCLASLAFAQPASEELSASQEPSASRARSCNIEGRVTSASTGEPLRRASVQLQPAGDNDDDGSGDLSSEAAMRLAAAPSGPQQPRQFATTSDDGRFCLENVKPGRYTLLGHKPGFLKTPYGAVQPSQRGAILTVTPQRPIQAALALTPYGVVSGEVRDAYREPIGAGMVQLLRRTWMRGKTRHILVGGAPVDDLGRFRVPNLPAGTYYAVFQPPPSSPDGLASETEVVDGSVREVLPVRTFYPQGATLGEAASIELKPGLEVRGVDILVQSASRRRLTGRVLGARHPDEQGLLSFSPADYDLTSLVFADGPLGPDGTFEFRDVAPGTYRIDYVAASSSGVRAAQQTVEVRDRDVHNVVVELPKELTVRGRITWEEGVPKEDRSSQVRLTDPFELISPTFSAEVRAGNEFVFTNLAPGKYALSASCPPSSFVKSVRYGSVDVTGGLLPIRSGRDEIEVVCGGKSAQLTGRVEADESATAYVVMAPVTARPDGSGLRFTIAAPNGQFTFRGVPPGTYRVFALAAYDRDAVQDPGFLRALESVGTVVDIPEGGEANAVLSLVSAKRVQQLSELSSYNR